MMKKENLVSLLAPYISTKNAILETEKSLTNITTNLQKAHSEDIVFYNLKSFDEKTLESFKKRLGEANPGMLILNTGSEFVKEENCLFIESEHFLKAQKLILDELFPNKNKMLLVGVTGTNGKTTTVNLAMQIATQIGFPAISVGTIGVQEASGPLMADIDSTTPSYVELRKIINQFQDKYKVCFLEVSSHALAQNRLFDLLLDGAAWTSFSQDHLDYHRSMEEYFKAKLVIAEKYLRESKSLIVPVLEGKLFNSILKEAPNTRIKYAKTLDERGYIKGAEERPLFYRSSYNQSNSEIALQLNADLFGDDLVKKIKLADIKTPKGRFSIIELKNESMAIIDYAHTPDALLNIGTAIKEAFPIHSLTVVFGCGGNRDKTKRPMMGKVVSSFADKIIVTSDNPRDEASEDIILNILTGVTTDHQAVVDRKKAIEFALSEIEDREIVLIAGKGHEEYQEIKGVKYPFSDFDVVMNFKEGKEHAYIRTF